MNKLLAAIIAVACISATAASAYYLIGEYRDHTAKPSIESVLQRQEDAVCNLRRVNGLEC